MVMALLLLPILLVLPSLVAAVDLTTYRFDRCQGDGTVFENVRNTECTTLESIPLSLFYSGGRNCGVSTYSDAACANSFVQGKNSECVTPGYGIGSSKYVVCSIFDGHRQLLGADTPSSSSDSAPCAKPKMTGVVYTEDLSKGSWVLKSDDAHALSTELAAVAVEDKASWFQARGGSFQPTTA